MLPAGGEQFHGTSGTVWRCGEDRHDCLFGGRLTAPAHGCHHHYSVMAHSVPHCATITCRSAPHQRAGRRCRARPSMFENLALRTPACTPPRPLAREPPATTMRQSSPTARPASAAETLRKTLRSLMRQAQVHPLLSLVLLTTAAVAILAVGGFFYEPRAFLLLPSYLAGHQRRGRVPPGAMCSTCRVRDGQPDSPEFACGPLKQIELDAKVRGRGWALPCGAAAGRGPDPAARPVCHPQGRPHTRVHIPFRLGASRGGLVLWLTFVPHKPKWGNSKPGRPRGRRRQPLQKGVLVGAASTAVPARRRTRLRRPDAPIARTKLPSKTAYPSPSSTQSPAIPSTSSVSFFFSPDRFLAPCKRCSRAVLAAKAPTFFPPHSRALHLASFRAVRRPSSAPSALALTSLPPPTQPNAGRHSLGAWPQGPRSR